MASKHLLFLVILSLFSSTLQDVTDNKVDSKDESPLADVAKEILKEKDLENLGGMVNNFLQSGGAKQVMDVVLQNLPSGENGGQLLENLGNFLKSGVNEDDKDGQKQKKATKKNDENINPMDLISGIGSIVGALQGGRAGGEGNPAALLQGLGSLLGAGNNQGGGTAALLQGLGSLLGSASQGQDKKETNGGDLLQGLGSIIGAAVGNQDGGDNNNAGALLQGLGSLLGGGQGGQGGINPEMIGNVISMFANAGDEKTEVKPSKEAPKKAKSEKVKTKKAKPRKGESKGVEGVLSLASSMLGKRKNEKGNSDDLDLNIILENLPLFVKITKSLGGPLVKRYLDPVDDLLSIVSDAIDDKKQFNFNEFLKRISRIYKAYNDMLAPYFKELLEVVQKSKSASDDDSFDFEGILNIASSLLSQGSSEKGKKDGGSSFLDYLPMIINTFNAFTGPEAQEHADSHAEHSWSIPPVLEKIHIYYDTFLSSDMGKSLVSYLGSQPTFKIFRDENDNFSYDKFEELIENHSFRRHWIQQVVQQLVGLLQNVSEERTYRQYVEMSIMFTNSFLKKSGFPKKAFIDFKKPAQSITNFANYAAKKYLDAEFDTKEYVEPAVIYVQDVLKMAHKSIAPGAESKELADKLTNTINMEIIEPVTRVNRAYRFVKIEPRCDKYVLCHINQEVTTNYESLPSLRNALYKGSSFIAAWFISSNTGTSYWDLYAIVTENKHCNDFHHETCVGFHEEEIKATTEYVHNEL